MEKITKRNIYTALINYAKTGELTFVTDATADTEAAIVTVTAEDLKAFAENEIALLDKRAARAKETAAKKRAEGDALTEAVAAALTDEYEATADIAARIEGEDLTLNKVVYRLNQLVAAGVAEKVDLKIAATETTKARTVKGFRLAQNAD